VDAFLHSLGGGELVDDWSTSPRTVGFWRPRAGRLGWDQPRRIRGHYLGALSCGDTDNQHQHSPQVGARKLIPCFRRFGA
jgi:hypothetical protein